MTEKKNNELDGVGELESSLPAGAAAAPAVDNSELDRVLDVRVRLSVELGRKNLPIADILNLGPGAVVEFSKAADEPLDILVNDQLIARGEPVVLGERYGVRISEVVSPNDRLRSSGLSKEDAA